MLSGFGFRISALLRPSDFGFRALFALILLFTGILSFAADPGNPPDAASSLRPPRGEMFPTFWEQYGAWLMVATAVLVIGISLIVWMLTRPKPVVPIPWSVQARRELESLRPLPEDGMLLSRVSQILRHHITAGFGLSSDEATTSEFCRSLVACEKIGPELALELSHFLKECDLRKFAAAPPPSPYDAVARSLKIIEAAENRLKQVNSVAAATGNSDSSGSASGREQRVASGA